MKYDLFESVQIYDAVYHLIGDIDPATMTDEEREDMLDCLVEVIIDSDEDVETAAAVEVAIDILYPHCSDRIVARRSLPDPFSGNPWIPVLDGDPRARALYERHYSSQHNMKRRKRRKTKLFMGPGEKLPLLLPTGDALFAWRYERFTNGYQIGVNCAVFRNESARLSSDLILHAEEHAMRYWPTATRFFTYVNPKHIRSTNPGYTFIKAGWKKIGTTSKGLIILEKRIVPLAYWVSAGQYLKS